MKRNPGDWLQKKLFDSILDVGLLAIMGYGWLCGAVIAVFVFHYFSWPSLLLTLLPGVAFLFAARHKWKGDWLSRNMKKGIRSERVIGEAIDRALTRDACAVAHNVEEITQVGDIDHLVATPNRLWVIETKHRRVPPSKFPETLRRIAANVEGVREWAPGTRVTGCLVFANKQQKRPKRTYKAGKETITAFGNPTDLERELRKEACKTVDSCDLADRVLELAEQETVD